MSETFKHGYALVVGVDENHLPHLALPAVLKDVQAVHDVLLHPERCAYEPENVQFLKGKESTRNGIFDALYKLQDQVKADPDSTVVIYYSGHGWREEASEKYYLIPYDLEEMSRARRYAISAEDFAGEISGIQSKRLLVILDCCHAGGMDVKSFVETAVIPTAFPLDLAQTKDIPEYAGDGAKAVSDLAQGKGRAILNSSTGLQQSFVRNDGKMSLFTYHLIEALTGHAPHPDDATTVLVTDVMSWVTRQVAQSAKDQMRDQTPVMRTTGVFPVAQLLGGKGLAKGMSAPDPMEPLLPSSQTTFNQQNQAVHGNQVNIAGDAQIDHIGDNIDTGGGDYIGRDKVIHGDVIQGDKVIGDQVGGDKISVGNISGGQGIAIGSNASANVTVDQGISGDDLNALFVPLVQAVAQNETAVAKVEALKTEVAQGDRADDQKIAEIVTEIANAAPTVIETLTGLFTNSIIAKVVGEATKFALKMIGKMKD